MARSKRFSLLVDFIGDDPFAGHAPPRANNRSASHRLPDVRAIRDKLGLSRADFAQLFQLHEPTVQHWEQGAIPSRLARLVLHAIELEPEAMARAAAAVAKRQTARAAASASRRSRFP